MAHDIAAMPKLSLRDLFAVLTLAAVLVAWWVDHRRLAKALILSNARCRVLAAEVEDLKAKNERLYGRDRWLTHELLRRISDDPTQQESLPDQ